MAVGWAVIQALSQALPPWPLCLASGHSAWGPLSAPPLSTLLPFGACAQCAYSQGVRVSYARPWGPSRQCPYELGVILFPHLFPFLEKKPYDTRRGVACLPHEFLVFSFEVPSSI